MTDASTRVENAVGRTIATPDAYPGRRPAPVRGSRRFRSDEAPVTDKRTTCRVSIFVKGTRRPQLSLGRRILLMRGVADAIVKRPDIVAGGWLSPGRGGGNDRLVVVAFEPAGGFSDGADKEEFARLAADAVYGTLWLAFDEDTHSVSDEHGREVLYETSTFVKSKRGGPSDD